MLIPQDECFSLSLPIANNLAAPVATVNQLVSSLNVKELMGTQSGGDVSVLKIVMSAGRPLRKGLHLSTLLVSPCSDQTGCPGYFFGLGAT